MELPTIKGLVLCFLCVGPCIIPAAAQSTGEFRPELGIYIQQGPVIRIEFVDSFSGVQSSRDWEGDFAFYVETALRPVFRRELRERPDMFRNKYLALRAGYLYGTSLTSGNSAHENRAILELTSRYILPVACDFRPQPRRIPVHPGSAVFHAISQQVTPGARCSIRLAELHAVRLRRDLLRYPVRSVVVEPVCPRRRVSGRSTRGAGTLLSTAKQQPLESASYQRFRI